MNKTQTFEELDRRIEGLDPIALAESLDGYTEREKEKYNSWSNLVDDLPPKDQKEYMEGIYAKTRQEKKTKIEHKKQILQTLPYPQSDLKWTQAGQDLNIKEIEKLNNNGIIREEVESVFFSFKQAHKKPKEFQQAFDFCNYNVQEQRTCQNLYYPEEVTIDY